MQTHSHPRTTSHHVALVLATRQRRRRLGEGGASLGFASQVLRRPSTLAVYRSRIAKERLLTTSETSRRESVRAVGPREVAVDFGGIHPAVD